jgi:hypothetical protein
MIKFYRYCCSNPDEDKRVPSNSIIKRQRSLFIYPTSYQNVNEHNEGTKSSDDGKSNDDRTSTVVITGQIVMTRRVVITGS